MLVLIDNYDPSRTTSCRSANWRLDGCLPRSKSSCLRLGTRAERHRHLPDPVPRRSRYIQRRCPPLRRAPPSSAFPRHQCIAEVFGSRVVQAGRILHGKTSPVHHDGSSLFHGVPSPFTATRYHSLVVDPSALSPDLAVTAWTAEGEIMGIRHRAYDVEGVQFHPESILTTYGPVLLANFLRRTGAAVPQAALRPRLPVERVGTAS